MLKRLFKTQTVFVNALALVRILTGMMIMHEGLGIFSKAHMDGNFAWLNDLHFPLPLFMAYLGKATELLGGFLLIIGFLTRFASIALLIDMFVIIFIMGKGEIFSDSAYPFCLMLLFFSFILYGSGKWSLNHLLFGRKQNASGPGQ